MRSASIVLVLIPIAWGCAPVPVETESPAPSGPPVSTLAEEPEFWVVPTRPGGPRVLELFESLHDRFGITVLYDARSGIADQRCEFVAEMHVPREHAIEWLTAVLAFHRIALVEVKDDDGGTAWYAFPERRAR